MRKSQNKARGNKAINSFMLIGAITFTLAVITSVASVFFLYRITSLLLAFTILMVIILIGVIFDIIGIASTAATEPPFHAKASERVVGAAEAVELVRNADRVAAFCNDVVGDVCGILSGAVGATIALKVLQQKPTWDEMVVTVIMTAIIAALTGGGKAVGKSMAITDANIIVFKVGKILAWVKISIGNNSNQGGKKPSKKRK